MEMHRMIKRRPTSNRIPLLEKYQKPVSHRAELKKFHIASQALKSLDVYPIMLENK